MYMVHQEGSHRRAGVVLLISLVCQCNVAMFSAIRETKRVLISNGLVLEKNSSEEEPRIGEFSSSGQKSQHLLHQLRWLLITQRWKPYQQLGFLIVSLGVDPEKKTEATI